MTTTSPPEATTTHAGPDGPAGDPAPRAASKVRLYSIPGSHASLGTHLLLKHKDIPHRRTDLLPVVSWGILKARGFPRVTVPAVTIDGRRIQGSREIARELERLVPEPPIFPPDPGLRSAVEEAERFGDDDLQQWIREIILWALKANTAALRSYLVGTKIGLPHGLAVRMAGPFIAIDGRSRTATDANVRRNIAIMPDLLQRIDDWIAEGVLGGDTLNAADFQIATSLRVAMSLDDLRPAIENRPAGRLALRVVPDYPGTMPPVLPAEWLEPLRAPA